jgi:hypothetical protein
VRERGRERGWREERGQEIGKVERGRKSVEEEMINEGKEKRRAEEQSTCRRQGWKESNTLGYIK